MTSRTAFELRYVLLLLCYLLANATLSIIAPIMPYLMKEKNIPTYYNSIVFCLISVSGLLSSLYTSKYLAKSGCKYFVYGGLLGLATVHMVYSMLSFLDGTTFIMVFMLNRALEGWTFGLIQGMVYGVSSQELPQIEFDKYARTCSASAGFGLSMSLLFGSFLFSIGGYFLPYFVLSSSFLILTYIIYSSNILNEKVRIHVKDDVSEESIEDQLYKFDDMKTAHFKPEVTHSFALKIDVVRYGCMSIIVANAAMAYLDPIIALKLFEMGILADKAGYVYVFMVGSYCLFGTFGGKLEKIASKKTLIFCGYTSGFIAFAILGHNSYFHGNHVSLIILGLFLIGFAIIGGNMFATMYTKAKLMETGTEYGYGKNELGGYFGGLKGSCNLIGSFLGAFISPYIYICFGFDYTCFAMSAFQICFLGFFMYKLGKAEKQQQMLPSSPISRYKEAPLELIKL